MDRNWVLWVYVDVIREVIGLRVLCYEFGPIRDGAGSWNVGWAKNRDLEAGLGGSVERVRVRRI